MASRRARLVGLSCAVALTGCSSSGEGARVGTTSEPSGSANHSTSGSTSLPAIDVGGLSSRAQPLIDAVRPDRAFADITKLAQTPRDPKQNPAATRAAAAYIRGELTKAGLESREIPVEHDGTTLPVVWAQIAGKRCPDKVFVLTGHYDTVAGSPGADDDASGIAAMLETARVLARAQPDASVVVAGLPFEEDGMPYPASRALATRLQQQGRTIVGMMSAEMLGYAAPTPTKDDPGNTLLVLGYHGSEGLVSTFAAAARAWTRTSPQWGGVEAGTYPPKTDFIDRSDHAAFHARGVPAAFATDGANFRTPHYHRASDVPANIVGPFFEGSVRTMLGGTFAMATLDTDGDGLAQACAGSQPS